MKNEDNEQDLDIAKITPNIGYLTDEPSLFEIVNRYYQQVFDPTTARENTNRYFRSMADIINNHLVSEEEEEEEEEGNE